jgi:dTDP-4-dehydrorhamnose reductase
VNALVLGAAGQLGSELVRLTGPDSGVPHSVASITDAAAMEALIADRKPSVVFNCAAYNAVDRAESEPELARAVNAEGPRNVAEACRRHAAWMVHFSTNFVFDGGLGEPYIESDAPNPLSVYAASKLAGEQEVMAIGSRVLVVRTAAVFGGPNSFPNRILERARAGGAIRVVSDQSVNPTYARDLAAAALELASDEFAGIVHAVNAGCSTWAEFATTALFEAGVRASVEAIRTGEYPAPARRPANGCLGTIRYHALRPWQEAVEEWAAGVRKA